MNKKIMAGVFFFFSLCFACYSKQLVIVFKDGAEITFDMQTIESFYLKGEESPFSMFEGEWHGDKGIKTCYINEAGLFSMQLNNGYAWSGVYQIENGLLILETPYPVPLEYMLNNDIPINIAKQAMKVIQRPDRWILRISDNGLKLIGQIRHFRLHWTDDRLLNVEYVERDTVWMR